ncbi:MAG: Dabb family protein [Planctomycetes bacterium]|nr:Dabb family protein [Planctomycetota bacterium]
MLLRSCLIGLGLVIFAAILGGQAQAPAQSKDELARQVQQLKKSLAERDKHVSSLQSQNQKLKQDFDAYKKKNPGSSKLQKDLDAANQSIKDKDAQIATLQDKTPKATAELSREIIRLRRTIRELESATKAPLVHTVILKLKKLDDTSVKTIYDEAGKTLAKIEGVRNVWIGKPAENATPELAQKGYQLGIVVALDDADALQKFLDDPLHKQFTERMGTLWERPVVYDLQRDTDDSKKDDAKKDGKK